MVIMSSAGYRMIMYSAGSGWGGSNRILFIWLCCCDLRGDWGPKVVPGRRPVKVVVVCVGMNVGTCPDPCPRLCRDLVDMLCRNT